MIPKTDREFSHRYNHTFVGWRDPDDGVVKAIHIDGVDNRVDFLARYNDNVVQANFRDLIFDYPELGFRTIDKRLLYFSRRIARGHKRGIQTDLITCVNAVSNRGEYISYETLDAVYNPNFTTDLSQKGHLVLMPQLALARIPAYKDRVLLYMGQRVGYERKGKIYLPYMHDYLSQDLESLKLPVEILTHENE